MLTTAPLAKCRAATRVEKPRPVLSDNWAVTESIGPLISRISKDLDCAVLIVEHNVQQLASVTDRMVAMNFGEVIAQGDPRTVLNDPAVQDAYFRARAEPDSAPSQPAARRRELVSTP